MRENGNRDEGEDALTDGTWSGDTGALDTKSLDRLFFEARTPRGWMNKPVASELVEQVYYAARMGPTSMNSTPARFVFVASDEGRAKLRPALSPGNVDRAMAAPVVAIIGIDHDFARHMPMLWPHRDVSVLFEEKPGLREATARRNAILQGAYFILAARASGLDCGPMSGFDATIANAMFFKGTSIRAEFLCCLGYGDPATLKPRLPRLTFEQACRWT